MLAVGAVLLALVTGCGSGDAATSGDSATDETTETSSAAPKIDDPAVEAAALRTVDVCALLDANSLGELGTIVADSHLSSAWGECGVDVTDAGGKTMEMVLYVGDQLIVVDDPTEELEGLPLVVDDEDPESCWISVLTSYETSLAVTFQVDYPGADACAAGRTALTKVVQTLHGAPPQYPAVPGTVLTVDPCEVADREAIETALGQKTFVEPKDLHECDFWSGDGTNYPLVSLRFYKGLPADAEDGEPVDLGGGVTAIQAKDEDSSVVSCDVSYRKVETPSEDEAPGYGEIVSVQFSGEPGNLDTATACEKAVAVARTVVPALGQA